MKLHPSNTGTQHFPLSRCLLLLAVVLSAASVCGWALPTDNRHANDDDKPLGKVPKLPVDSLPKDISATKIPGGFNEIPNAPADNATTAEKVRLGRKLFLTQSYRPTERYPAPVAISLITVSRARIRLLSALAGKLESETLPR